MKTGYRESGTYPVQGKWNLPCTISKIVALKGSLTTVHGIRWKFDEGPQNDAWPDRVSAQELRHRPSLALLLVSSLDE